MDDKISGVELGAFLRSLAIEASARGHRDVAARIEHVLKFMLGSMHEFFGEARDALRDFEAFELWTPIEINEIARTVNRTTNSLGMDNR